MTKQQRSLWSKLPQWAWKQGLRTNVDFASNPDSRTSHRAERDRPEHTADIKQAQIITSRVEYPEVEDFHKPILDIDFPIQCVPSTTPGHFHLYMDKELTWDKYKALLHALADAGIIEDGYRWASIAREYTAVRVPWVRKEAQPEAPAPEEAPAAPAPEEAAQPLPGSPEYTHILREMQAQDPVIQNLRTAYESTPRQPLRQDFGPPPVPRDVLTEEERATARRNLARDLLHDEARRARRSAIDTFLHNEPRWQDLITSGPIRGMRPSAVVVDEAAGFNSEQPATPADAAMQTHTVRGWDHPQADPMGDIIAAAEAMRRTPF